METTKTRDKWAEARQAWLDRSPASLPSDNPYRYLVSVHDDSWAHRGMQRSCPACSEPDGGVR